MIASPHNPLVKHLVKLREDKHYRIVHDSVLVTGYKLVHEVVAHTPAKKWFVTDSQAAYDQKGEVIEVSTSVMKKITGLPSPEPIAAEFPLPKPHSLIGLTSLLVLDAIRDPGNLGTLLRTALALGWGGVFLLPTCVDLCHEKVIRASRAAPFRLFWQEGTWEEIEALQKTEKFQPFIADTSGNPLHAIPPPSKPLLLLSNESQGVRGWVEKLGQKITIPMDENMESLNVAVAGAILMYSLGVHK